MQYRQFGTTSWMASVLGFGCMRLPLKSDDPAEIDQDRAREMILYAVDQGVNYLDTAYPYHRGQSEPFLGTLLSSDLRNRVKVATKLPCWKINHTEDFDRLLEEQLSRLQIEQIDFYLLHALKQESWQKMCRLGVLPWLECVQQQGRIDRIGFSFHDDYPVFREILQTYQHWDFCQIQYNYMDVNYQAGRQGLQKAAELGLAVVIMEPIRGGRLVNPPHEVRRIWQEAPVERSPAEWALKWLWNQPEVSLVLSGMSTLDQVRENVAAAGNSGISTLSGQEREIIRRVREAYQSLSPIPCTGCGYCLPCPQGVEIPRIISIYHDMIMYHKPEYARREYLQVISPDSRADLCQACGECEQKCPQRIPISEWMLRIHAELVER